MATLTIDSGDTKTVLLAASRFLAELGGEPVRLPAFVEPATPVDLTPGPVTHIDDVPTDIEPTTDAALAALTDPNVAELDDSGRIWDKRIDSSSKAKNTNGTWKARRKVDPELRKTVLAEILGNIPPPVMPQDADQGTSVVQTPVGATAQPAVVAPSNEPNAAEVFGAGRDIQTGAPSEIPNGPLVAAPVQLTWPQVLVRITAGQAAGTLIQADAEAWLQANGVQKVPLLNGRPDLFLPFLEAMGL